MKSSKWLLLVLPFLLSACGYNTIQGMDETAAAAKQQIEVQLQRHAVQTVLPKGTIKTIQ